MSRIPQYTLECKPCFKFSCCCFHPYAQTKHRQGGMSNTSPPNWYLCGFFQDQLRSFWQFSWSRVKFSLVLEQKPKSLFFCRKCVWNVSAVYMFFPSSCYVRLCCSEFNNMVRFSLILFWQPKLLAQFHYERMEDVMTVFYLVFLWCIHNSFCLVSGEAGDRILCMEIHWLSVGDSI